MIIELLDLETEVRDTLTGESAKIIGVKYVNGIWGKDKINNYNVVGYQLNNDWLGGGRMPWEIFPIDPNHSWNVQMEKDFAKTNNQQINLQFCEYED